MVAHNSLKLGKSDTLGIYTHRHTESYTDTHRHTYTHTSTVSPTKTPGPVGESQDRGMVLSIHEEAEDVTSFHFDLQTPNFSVFKKP